MKSYLKKSPAPGKRLLVVEKGQQYDHTGPSDAATVEIGRQIIFNPAVLDTFDVKGFQPRHYDLLVLCAAIEFADRHWKRPQNWNRVLHVTLPVNEVGTWRNPEVLRSLQDTLGHLTCDTWRFSFVRAKNKSPIGTRQIPFDFGRTKTFAVPYSDGLDSRAVSALSGHQNEALCIRVAGEHQRPQRGDNYFTQIPFKVRGYRTNESSFRSRAFQFATVTAIAAQLSGVMRIVVPESGQGALGPVLLPLHKIYADYRNHPTFFRKMERFVNAVQGHRVRFEQPRLWFTKGQTLRAFLDLPGKKASDLTSSHSCWQRRRVVNVGSRRHCGLCAACLLRRLSLHAVDVKEKPETYIISDLSAPDVDRALSVITKRADKNIMIEYGSVGVRHLQHLADMARLPDDDLRVYASEIAAATGAAYDETLKKLRALLIRRANEWQAFIAAQGEEGFLKSWLDGGRYARSK